MSAASGEVAVPRPRRALRPRPGPAMVALMVVLLALSAVAWRFGIAADRAPINGPALGWWLLAPFFAVAEVVVLHVRIRREAQAISLSEIPMVVALLMATPGQTLLASILGSGLVYVLVRRQSPLKALFNTTLRVVGATAALLLVAVIADPGHADATGPQGWLAALVAVTVAGVMDGLLVLIAVALYDGSVQRHDVLGEPLGYSVISALVGCVGVLTATAVHADARITPLVLVVCAALLLGYRSHASLNSRHVNLAQLYTFGREVAGARTAEEIVRETLSAARDLLQAEAAEIVLLGIDGNGQPHRWRLAPKSAELTEAALDPRHPSLWRGVLETRQPLVLSRAAPCEQLTALAYHDAVVVPIRDGSRVLGTLMAAQRRAQAQTFDADDLPMLESIANQAGLVLARERLLQHMHHEATHDVLTGLANRAKFRDAADVLFDRVDTGALAGFALLLIDLNGFKKINDSLGHHHGDEVLVHVAAELAAAAPAGATVARLGGDEFAVLVAAATTAGEALIVADRLHRALTQSLVIEGREVHLGASIGVALGPQHSTDLSGLLRAADIAMYRAKTRKSGPVVHDPDRRWDAVSQAHPGVMTFALLP